MINNQIHIEAIDKERKEPKKKTNLSFKIIARRQRKS